MIPESYDSNYKLSEIQGISIEDWNWSIDQDSIEGMDFLFPAWTVNTLLFVKYVGQSKIST